MSKILTTLKDNGEWIWRLIIFLMLFASLYLSQTYVSKVEYREDQSRVFAQLQTEQMKVSIQLQADQSRISMQLIESDKKNNQEHSEISKSLILINNTLTIMGNITDRLSDHENRLRTMERLEIEINTRLINMEKK